MYFGMVLNESRNIVFILILMALFSLGNTIYPVIFYFFDFMLTENVVEC